MPQHRVLYLGDSITAGGGYIALRNVSAFRSDVTSSTINCGLPSETISGLSEVGHADGRFPRPDLFERLDRVMKLTKPTHVIACYGINCGIYEPFDAERFDKYKTGWERLQEKSKIYNAKLTIVTPPFYDDLKAPKKGFSYNDVLGRYSKWLVKQRERGWDVIDLHSAMTEAILNERKKNPEFSVQPDGVHPNAAGHWLIAQCLNTHEPSKLTPDQISAGLKFLSQKDPASDPAAFKRVVGCDPEVLKLAQQRMSVLRDANVAAAGHKRPGVAKGLPIDEATKKADELTAKIRELLAK
jgi:lysophospholipase L1-like esterase